MRGLFVLVLALIVASCAAFSMAPMRSIRSQKTALQMADLTDTMKFKTVFRLKFSSLYGAIVAAGLEETLKGGDFTSKQ